MPLTSAGGLWHRVLGVLARAREAQRRRDQRRRPLGRALTGAVCVLAGLMIMVSAWNAQGSDLRPGRNTDLVGLIQDQSRRNAELVRRLTGVREEVDRLSAAENEPDLAPLRDHQAVAAGLTAVVGPAVTVTLSDAPASVAADGIDPDLLVVHQQDIQAVVNALWGGGAEAMTIQGQRVISTTGVKCVGNTVVLHGVPYAPPYAISAMETLPGCTRRWPAPSRSRSISSTCRHTGSAITSRSCRRRPSRPMRVPSTCPTAVHSEDDRRCRAPIR